MIKTSHAEDALIILGHGTTLNDGSAEPVLRHAAELNKRRIFREVRPAFWKQEPRIRDVLDQVRAKRVFIVPMFLSEGFFSASVIPKALGFGPAGNKNARTREEPGRRIFYCAPVGSHPALTQVLLLRAHAVLSSPSRAFEPPRSETTLFVAGHGTPRNKNSRAAVERHAEQARRLSDFAAVHTVYLEEEPGIEKVYSLAKTRYIVIVPFFISNGLHVDEDLPVLLGEKATAVRKRLQKGMPAWNNPTERQGKLLYYSPAVGMDPAIEEVILDIVLSAASGSDQSPSVRAAA